ncbi:MAG: response regulator [Ruminococcaceae bacterium]|nr:response regulator [Oscillospiraceae bacterium]
MSDKALKILMIDDDDQILFALRAVFQFQGWASVSAGDVLEGLELFRTEAPDLVLIDYHLPRINGIKGVEMIRELDAEVPIIVFTIDESQEVANQFIEAGASDFALKPIKAPDIISRIRLHIRLLESNKRLNSKDEMRRPVSRAKGIGTVTLELIQSAFRTDAEYLTVETIAERTGLAYQTTYRYLQHMALQGLVEISQNYGKVGRPKQKYRLKRQRSSV